MGISVQMDPTACSIFLAAEAALCELSGKEKPRKPTLRLAAGPDTAWLQRVLAVSVSDTVFCEPLREFLNDGPGGLKPWCSH